MTTHMHSKHFAPQAHI